MGIVLTTSAVAVEAKPVQPSKMTCSDFLALSDTIKPRAVAWLEGYNKAGKVKEQDLGEVEVDRQTAVMVALCKQSPTTSFWGVVSAMLPMGNKRIKPTKMTCQEFVDLDDTTRPQAVYWLAGYKAGGTVKEGAAAEVDLERDIGVVVVDCKQAPKESLWEKIKKTF